MGVAERLERGAAHGAREVVGRCPTRADAQETATWLEDRFARLTPDLAVRAAIEPGGGKFLVAVSARR